MAAGADVIYQATFFDGTWRGHADFLLRIDDPTRPSRFGPYHYEVADTKLARHVKASAVLQICTYVDLLEAIQGVRPRWMHVALGGSTRLGGALAGRRLHGLLPRAPGTDSSGRWPPKPRPTYPPTRHLPGPRRALRRLSLGGGVRCSPAGRRPPQPRRRDLGPPASSPGRTWNRRPWQISAASSLPLRPPLEATSGGALAQDPRAGADPARGPPRGASPGTSSFSPAPGLRSTRSAASPASHHPRPATSSSTSRATRTRFDDGLDYLFGVLDVNDGTFHAFWSRDAATASSRSTRERRAFERLMDFFMERLARATRTSTSTTTRRTSRRPSSGSWGATGRARTRSTGSCAGGVLVDLLRVVRQSLRASVESYSIKKMEAFYGFVREIDLRDAGSSIVAFEQWLELGDGERPAVEPPRADRAVQPRRRRQQPAAARLARGPPRRARRRPPARKCRDRSPASTRSSPPT